MHERPSEIIEAGAPGTFLAAQEVSFKGGDLYVGSPEYPTDPVAPGGVVDVSVEVCNAANYISPLPGGDRCTDGRGFRGYTYDIRLVEPDGTEQERDNCLGMGGSLGTNCTQHEWSFQAPDYPGVYEFAIEAKMNSSDSFDPPDRQTAQIVVEEDAPTRPDQDDPGNDDGSGSDVPWTAIIIALGALGGAAIVLPEFTN